VVKFGDMAENVAVRVDPADAQTDIYVGLEHLDPETLHLRKWGHPSDVIGQKLAFKKDDVIFGRRRAYQRKLAVAEFDGICSAHAMVVRAKPKMILPEFLPFFLQADMFMERAIEISVGSLSPTINWKTLRIQEFPLPPIEEQKRIADILWAADEVVENWSQSIESLNSTSSTVMNYYLSTRSTENVKIRDANILVIDGDRGKNYPKASEYLDQENGYCLFLNAKNVTKNGFLFEENQFISKEKDFALRKGKLQRSDIVLTTRGTVGNVAYYDESVPFDHVRINSGMVILRNESHDIETEFLYRFFASCFSQNQIKSRSYGSAQPQLSVKIIEDFELPIISLEEQRHVIRLIKGFDLLVNAIEKNTQNIRSVSKALWNSSFDYELEATHV